ILKQAAARELKGKETAALTGCHPVHISRLKKKVMASGIQGILRPKLPSRRPLPDSLKEQVKNLYQQIYYDFNIRRFNRKMLYPIPLRAQAGRHLLRPSDYGGQALYSRGLFVRPARQIKGGRRIEIVLKSTQHLPG
ncbi:MAG: hypothetical protein B1H08_01295, partial [Candidatus Omnitrophica bacterium 4484_171]